MPWQNLYRGQLSGSRPRIFISRPKQDGGQRIMQVSSGFAGLYSAFITYLRVFVGIGRTGGATLRIHTYQNPDLLLVVD